MPIRYAVRADGRFIHATAYDTVTDKDLVEYEIAFASDERITHPADELLEFKRQSVVEVTRDGILEALERKKGLAREQVDHRCAIVVPYGDSVTWDLAKFYESMAMLHSAYGVIVFGDVAIARLWLGVDGDQP